MKVEAVQVKRFQSLWDVELELGDLTVIVGPSNSGKSAIGRAIRTVARNSSGSSFVSHGAKTATVTLQLSNGKSVTVERGAGTSTYKIGDHDAGTEEVYAKSGTQVPEDVSKLLATPLPEDGPDPHFTTQFDGPFLLNAAGATSAKAIGDLTNVTLLAEAAREANRRRQEAQRLAKTRKDDAARAATEVRSNYANLPERKKLLEEARELWESSREASSRADRLESLAERAATAELAAKTAEAEAAKLAAQANVLTDELDDANRTLARIAKLEELAAKVSDAANEASSLDEQAKKLEAGIEAAEEKIHDLLKEAGQCPTCLRKTA